MCGIAGKYVRTSGSVSHDEVQSYTHSLSHRGPDGFGIYCNGSIGLGHRRLSIIDLSINGHQPMKSENGNFVITYNGEIYNYLEIRKELEAIGYQFEGHSDTSVIINGYQAWGDQIFAKLNGIFAIAIWDIQNAVLTLTRDRLGVKPLYYFVNEQQINFGSEIKAIIEDKSIKRVLDWQSFHEFLYYGNALGKNTMFKNIKKLKPGSILKIGKNDEKQSSFHEYTYDNRIDSNPISENEAINQTKNLLEQAVKRQLVGDVPVGVFLSGGIDSSAITAFATKHYDKKILSYSAGFDFDDGHNELPLASKVASKFKTEHTEIMIQGRDIIGIIEKLVFHHDEPFSDAANIPLFLMTSEVKDKCKVVLQGDGGDELFAGYPRYHILAKMNRYKHLFKFANKLKPLIPFEKIRYKVNRFDFPFDLSYKMYARLLTPEIQPLNFTKENIQKDLLKTNPFQRYEELCLQFDNILDPVQKLLWIDTQVILQDQFLEKVDKSTMANGVEVRVPFLDNDLANFAMSLPADMKVKGGVKKYLLKKALHDILPHEVLYGPKKGFGVPYSNWLRGPIHDYLKSILQDSNIKCTGILNMVQINKAIEEHKAGKGDWGFILWKLLNFCIWLKTYEVQIENE